jgi:hypothetical protein
MAVYRHSVGELHPISVFRMKIQYVERLVVEVDVLYKPLLILRLINPLEYHRVCEGGADDRFER